MSDICVLILILIIYFLKLIILRFEQMFLPRKQTNALWETNIVQMFIA